MSVPIVPTSNGWMQVGAVGKAMDKVGQMPDQIAAAQYENSPLNDMIGNMKGNIGKNAAEKDIAMAKTIESGNAADAITHITAGAAPNTNMRDYSSLSSNLAKAGNTTDK